MNTEDQVIDDIDALVDAQLRQEASGYDHNINQASCPHDGCAYTDWHGLKLYGCPGSAVHGPVEPSRGNRRKKTEPSQWGLNGSWVAPSEQIEEYARQNITGADPHEDLGVDRLLWAPNPLLPAEITFYDAEFNETARVQARNIELTYVPTSEDVREAWDRMTSVVTTAVRQLEVTFQVVGTQLRELAALFDLPDPDRGDVTPQQRALPRPSRTPPMWANDPTKTRRRR